MAKNARDIVAKWSRNLGSSGDSMRDGINAVSESPGVKAADAIDNYAAGVQAALSSGKTERRMRSVTLEGWKGAALEKGVPRAIAAANSPTAKAHALEFMEAFLPFAENVSNEISRMPKGTLEDGIARATAAIRLMATFTFDRRR